MRRLIIPLLMLAFRQGALAQENDLLKLIDEQGTGKEYLTNAFKSSRVINGHSIEFLGAGVLDVRILHRFGPVNSGIGNLFGLDQANMRMGLDYGISKRLMIGLGRSNVNKELDGFIKYRPVWQARNGSPVSVVWVSGITLGTAPWPNQAIQNYFSSRLAFYHELIIGRKFSNAFSLQLAPVAIHRNLVDSVGDSNDTYALGIGARIKLSNRVALVADYHPVLYGRQSGTQDPLSMGFDIETGGHVFQLHFSNATGMNEKAFITNTKGEFLKGEVRFGFNLSRVFTVRKPRSFREGN